MSHLDEGQLHELLDGELDAAARAAALAHLASCERCKAAYDEAAEFLAESDALIDAVQVPAGVESRQSKVESQTSKVESAGSALDLGLSIPDSRRKRRLTTYRTLAWAASLVVAVGIGWYGSGLRRAAEFKATTDEVARAVLADSPAPAAPSLPSQVAAPETRAKVTEEATADRSLSRHAPPRAQTAGKAGPDDALAAAAANNQPAATPAAEPTAEASGMMAQQDPAPAPPAGFTPLASLDERRREADKEAAAPRPAKAGADRAFTAKQATAPTTFRVIEMEEAVRILGGSIRLIDGLTPTRVLAGRAGGGDRAATVRVVYQDPPGRELWLDQQREAGVEVGRANTATALLPGDTLMVVREEGVRSLDWVDQSGFLLRLTGYVPADSLQRLQARVR